MILKLNRLLKSYWLKEPQIGVRKVLFYYFLLLLGFFALLITEKFSLALILLVEGILVLIFLFYKLLISGYYHRVKEFKEKYLEIVDFKLPFDSHKNYRQLKSTVRPVVLTKIFLHPDNDDFSQYDYACLFAQNFLNKPVSNALILGGGGGSRARFLARKYKEIEIDVVEISPQIIDIAKQYFLETETIKKITFYNQDAADFVKNWNKKYQFIFHDLFEPQAEDELPDFSLRSEFINGLKLLLAEDGILVVNAGFKNVNFSGRMINEYKEIFEEVYIFVYGGQVVLLTHKMDPEARQKLHQKLIGTKKIFNKLLLKY